MRHRNGHTVHVGYIEIGNLAKQKYAIWKLLAVQQYDALLLMNTKVNESKIDEERLKFPDYTLYQNYQRNMCIYARSELAPRQMLYSGRDRHLVDTLTHITHLFV